MRPVRITLSVALIGVIGTLLYMVVDGAISLDYSRSQNLYLHRKCELLAKLVDEGLRGRSIDTAKRAVGSDVIAKVEGNELRLDNVVLQISDGKIARVEVAETCR